MEQPAVEWGVAAQDYWQMTFREIMMQVTANRQRHEFELKEKAMLDYKLAQLNAYAFNDPQKMPKPDAVYPFMKDEQQQLPVSEQPYSAEEDKAIFMAMANAVQNHNERKRGEVDGTGNT